jgi:hypothetical protein
MEFLRCPSCGIINRIKPHDRNLKPRCGNCHASLTYPSFHSESNCLICGDICINSKVLINGTFYHKECYNRLRDKEQNLSNQINEIDAQIFQINSKIIQSSSKIIQLKNWITRKKIDVFSLEKLLKNLQYHHQDLVNQRNESDSILDKLHSYWPTYPPDWEKRKSELYEESNVCEKCGSYFEGPKHIHHIIPVSKGGSHRFENLEVLCEICHSKKHGKREFSYSDKNKTSYFAKRVQMRKQAIESKKIVNFHYRKFHGQKSVRQETTIPTI